MNIRTFALASLTAGAIAASQVAFAGPAHAIGSANGGVWKTTNGGAVAPPALSFTTPENDPSPLLVPAVQRVRCASSYC